MTEARSGVAPAGAIDLVVLVAGMHRSGTSAVTGALHRLGIPAAGSQMRATAENPRGYYESVAVMAFHEAFLSAIGSDWSDPEPIAPDLFRTTEGLRWVADLAKLIGSDLVAVGPVFSVKDPRLCRLIPLWRAALASLGATPRVLIPLRHPRAVAASLLDRRGIDEGHALSLWLAHVLETERTTRDLVRTFVVYDRLLDEPLPTVERLIDQLGARDHVDLAGARESVEGFLTDALRHHVPDGPAKQPEAAHLAERCWASLQPFLTAPQDLGAMYRLDHIRRAFDAGPGSDRTVEVARPRVTKVLKTPLPRTPAEMAAEAERFAAFDTRLDATEKNLGLLRSDVAQTQRTLDETRKPIWRLRRRLSELRRRNGHG